MSSIDPLEAIIASSNDSSINQDAAAIASSLEEHKSKAIKKALSDDNSDDTDSEDSEDDEPKPKKHKKQKSFKKGPARTVSIPLPKGSVPSDVQDVFDPISTFNEEKVEYANSERKVRKKEAMQEQSWFKRHSVGLKRVGYVIGAILLLILFTFIGYKAMIWYKQKKHADILTDNNKQSLSGGTKLPTATHITGGTKLPTATNITGGNRSNVVTIKNDNGSWSDFTEEEQPDYDINVNRDIGSKFIAKDAPSKNKSVSGGSVQPRDAKGRFVKRSSTKR